MLPSVIVALIAVASAASAMETENCKAKKGGCNAEYYEGDWEAENYGIDNVKDTCKRLVYKVSSSQNNELKFIETCLNTQDTSVMEGTVNESTGSIEYQISLKRKRVRTLKSLGTLPGMTFVWKKDGEVVAASVQHPLLLADNTYVRSLWIKKNDAVTNEEYKKILALHVKMQPKKK